MFLGHLHDTVSVFVSYCASKTAKTLQDASVPTTTPWIERVGTSDRLLDELQSERVDEQRKLFPVIRNALEVVLRDVAQMTWDEWLNVNAVRHASNSKFHSNPSFDSHAAGHVLYARALLRTPPLAYLGPRTEALSKMLTCVEKKCV